MGWLFSDRWSSRKELIGHLTREDRFISGWHLLKSRPVGNNHWYLLENRDTGQKIIGLDLMKGGKREWGYKDMDESCGPYQVNCPMALIKEASPPEGYAVEWREKVIEYHQKKASRPTLARGLIATYNGTAYELIAPYAPRKGWSVERVSDHMAFRMTARQLNEASIA